jgi:osmotically-inducible protein OsmY
MYQLAATAAVAMIVTSSPLRASETDDKVKAAFEKSYVYKTYLKDDAIKTEVKDGVVTLSGTVADESRKTLAQETAAGLPGVTKVNNQLVTQTNLSTESSDSWIDKKVKLTLLFHRNVNYSKTHIQVKDGIVTLKGEAENAAQKDLTAEYAKDIDGVKGVKNEMTVAAATPEPAKRTADEKVDDASITAQVKTALLTHRSTSALKTSVQTRSGEVTVTGIAKSDAEKALVSKLVNDIQGVTSVKNQMTVEKK